MSSSADELRARVKALDASLRRLLSLVDSDTASDAAIERALCECSTEHARISQLSMKGLDDATRVELEESLATLTCLNAMAVERLEQNLTATLELLERTRKAQAMLRGYRSADDWGGSCDVSG